MSAPIRIADAGTVRLLAAGDRVDVIAIGSGTADGTAAGRDVPGSAGAARVVATGARVSDVPSAGDTSSEPSEISGSSDPGALIVLDVSRATATALAGAGATSELAVTLC
ncbi:RcpC/CpaB family pilus assembly protein [Streptomyces sp. NBC_00859]|uniref:RcpC/CpaB family pilus assembly protein n=1 Tax=Streptomyces sp. NBC_00859 TaxID=2903682 RepID=UPI0038653C7D|nr:RcpC/CpaB family pilus assembly protein [Streptomyces sp. NBC_00859]